MKSPSRGFRALRIITTVLLFLLSGLCFEAQAVTLSDSSRITLLTCAPGEDLYSAFGHTGIRVTDYKQQFDIVFNYGTFDFAQKGFYINFLRGKMRYMLDVETFQEFMSEYIIENRGVTEQELNLTPGDREQVFAFLYQNSQPENREYNYDFFWDNCATRPRDVFEKVLGSRLQYHTDSAGFQQHKTLHQMLKLYLHNWPWIDFGFDVALGLPCEKLATPRDQTFLPDYLAKYFDCATVDGKPFVTGVVPVVTAPLPVATTTILPVYITFLLLAFGLVIMYFERSRGVHNYHFDFLIFLISGLTGVCLLSLWLFTVHYSVPRNMNMLWLLPTHFFVSFLLLRKQKPAWLKTYFLATGFIALLVFLTWKWNPQPLNYAFLPLLILLSGRAFWIYYSLSSPKK